VNATGTIQVGNWVTDYIKETSGTVEIGNKTGFSLSTTSTVPVSFADTSTIVPVNDKDNPLAEAIALTGGTRPTTGVLDVALLGRYLDDDFSQLQAITVDSMGQLYVRLTDISASAISDLTSSTMQIGNWITDYIKTTSGTVEVGDKTGFSLSTTSTVPVSFSAPVTIETTTSTIPEVTNIGSTVDIRHVDSVIAVPSDLQANYYTSTLVISASTNVSTGVDVSSGDISCADYVTKTVSVYASTAASTITIKISPSGTNTYYDYYTDGTVTADALWTRSFTEAFDYMKVVFTGGTTASTLSMFTVGLQTG